MGCNCNIDLSDCCDYEAPVCFESHEVRARKPHKCCECRRVIAIGETYRHESGLWEGEWSKFKTCSDCAAVQNLMLSCGYEYGTMWEAIGEYVQEVRGDVPEACLAALPAVARGRICEMIQEEWRRAFLEEARRRIARMQAERRRKKAAMANLPEPRYDEVYYEGLAMLDRM